MLALGSGGFNNRQILTGGKGAASYLGRG